MKLDSGSEIIQGPETTRVVSSMLLGIRRRDPQGISDQGASSTSCGIVIVIKHKSTYTVFIIDNSLIST